MGSHEPKPDLQESPHLNAFFISVDVKEDFKKFFLRAESSAADENPGKKKSGT